MHASNSKLFRNIYCCNKKVLSIGSLSFFHGMQLVLAAYVNCAFVACSGVCEAFWIENTKGIKAAMPKSNIFLVQISYRNEQWGLWKTSFLGIVQHQNILFLSKITCKRLTNSKRSKIAWTSLRELKDFPRTDQGGTFSIINIGYKLNKN